MLKSLPSCYFKPTLNLHNLTSLLSARILFLSFRNIAVNLGLTICGQLQLISKYDERVNIKDYNLVRADHPSNKKREGVCMYYKEHLPIIERNDLCTLKECLVTVITVDKKKIFFVFI